MIRAEVIGNLGADAKIIKSQSGEFVSLSVCSTRKYHNQAGELIEEKHWVNVAINFKCEGVMPYLVKGAKVFVEGAVHLRTFQIQNGEHKGEWTSSMDINARSIELCGTPRDFDERPL